MPLAIPGVSTEVLLTGLIIVGLLVGLVLARGVMALARWTLKQTPQIARYFNVKRLRPPLYTALPVLTVFVTLRVLMRDSLDDPAFIGLIKVSSVALVYWLVIRVIDITSTAIARRYDITVRDNLRARQIHTRIAVIRRILMFLVLLLALAAVFLMFEQLRTLGVSLLASAGIAGVVLGFAAQKTLGNLLAGIQIALTQPIRLEDAIVVENEWGWVEEITLTYVVLRLWDLRRLVLPIGYFIEHPFQNWTRTSADIIGTVELYADYTLPVEPLRGKLKDILAETTLWDGKTQVVQVTECDKTVMKIRILVSAGDSPTAWDLRCLVREQMITFIQAEYPQCLPRTRADMAGAVLGDAAH
jgi:small-conductance mechanosensitive channel